ncbi:unnamed protein product [Notodromas monacha]|uniref:AAA+ ATPase domain-containing protein n=1 Tax=Notodromas monacha TaxID=399045 RepID=A0A7R9BQ74_9CRUS|nr:unnamed protein product [Notodromas monacha]CAG0918290.1 unnamed protein product [Notodromas monacha]
MIQLPPCPVMESITVFSPDQLRAALSNPRNSSRIESTFLDWIGRLEHILIEQQRARREVEQYGPLYELEYWRIRSAFFGNLCIELRTPKVRAVVSLMDSNQSRGMPRWKEVVQGIFQEHGRAENIKHALSIIERQLAPLYLFPPDKLIKDMRQLFNTIKFIHTLTPNESSQRLSPLLIKITTQMINSCNDYISSHGSLTIWTQPKQVVRRKLELCLELHSVYRRSFHVSQGMLEREGVPAFTFSTHLVFGKFDSFAKRLQRIMDLLQMYDRYHNLLSSGIEGMLIDEKTIGEMSASLDEMMDCIARKNYDCLDSNHRFFESDYDAFIARLNLMIDKIRVILEKEFSSVWKEPTVNMIFLKRFEQLNDRIPGLATDKKATQILRAFNDVLDKVKNEYNTKKDNPPLPRNMPEVAGSIVWIRGLFAKLSNPIKRFQKHVNILKRPEAALVSRRYLTLVKGLVGYEISLHKEWRERRVTNILFSLSATVLIKDGSSKKPRLVCNFDPEILAVIREAEALKKLNLDLPRVILGLVESKSVLLERRLKIQQLVGRYKQAVSKIPEGFVGLFENHLHRIDEALRPGLRTVEWSSKEIPEFVDEATQIIDSTEVYFIRHFQLMEDSLIEMLSIILHSDPCRVRDLSTVAMAIRMAHRTRSSSGVDHDEAASHSEEHSQGAECSGTPNAEDNHQKRDHHDNHQHHNQVNQQTEPGSSLGGLQRNLLPICSGSTLRIFKAPAPNNPDKCDDHRIRRQRLLAKTHTACEELVGFYTQKLVDILVSLTRSAIEDLAYFMDFNPPVESHSSLAASWTSFSGEVETKEAAIQLEAILENHRINLKPSINQIREMLLDASRIMLTISRTTSQWTRVQTFFGGHQYVRSETYGKETENRKASGDKINYPFPKPWMTKPRIPPEDKYCPTPVRPNNFFKPISENKEIVRCMNSLTNRISSLKSETKKELDKLSKFSVLWMPGRDQEVREMLRRNPPPNIYDFEQKINDFMNLDREIRTIPNSATIGPIHISYEKLKLLMEDGAKAWITSYCRGCKIAYKRKLDKLLIRISDMSRKLSQPIRDLDELSIGMQALRQIRENEVDMEMAIDPIEESFALVQKHQIRITREETDKADSLRYTWHTLQAQANEIQALLANLQAKFRHQLAKNLQQFEVDSAAFCEAYYESGPMVNGLVPKEASERLLNFQNRFDTLWRRYVVYSTGQELFGMEQSDFPKLFQIRKELNLLQKLYRLYNDVLDKVNSYYEILWVNVNIEEINNELMEFQNRCRKLPKGLKEWPAFNSLKKIVDDFNDMCPLIELMANKAMKRRHWDRLSEVTDYVFDVENTAKFSLKEIMLAPLLQHREDIEDICISAVKERDIESKLKTVTNDWAYHELTFMSFKNRGELLLRGDSTAEIITLLEDSLMVLGSLLSNRYNAPFRGQILKWVSDLTNASEILERWLFVQNLWVYLEAVFVGGDIAKQLPREAKRFYSIDKTWQKVMSRARDLPNVVSCCVGDEFLKQCLPNLHAELEICQKSLSGYLEKKRMMFPRFFFVSDPALLEILGQASDSHTIQDHLKSIFDNTKSVIFHEQNYDRITAIVSSEGETITLVQPVRAEGSVESWLMRLLQASQYSVHSIIRTAHKSLSDPNFDLLVFANVFPTQVNILGLQMIWTRDSEIALLRSKIDKKIMGEANSKCLAMLNVLIAQTTKDLCPVERTKFETLITIHVHQRDIFDNLCRMSVKSVTDFEWLKQCRVYFREDQDQTVIQITDVSFVYQNEFLGCTERLVITPLTDRCYITLAQALGMSMGGSPTGPAGTGKTETTKDLGKTLGKYVVVFNCSDQMDYRGLGRIFKGLAQSGTWGCFDEFNRIELPVLSVAAQQIAMILNCKKEKKSSFIFMDGDLVDMNLEFGIFLTMNPGYAGRKELPENLKIQFRTVAMMVPDRQIIIRVKLASCGFLENITLARKFFTLYKLCEEQMTKQVHYDFGLRNILSVLRTLGSAKRANPRDSESMTVMRVLRDMNLSKLVDEDEPLFMSLISDLFPNVTLDKAGHPKLEKLIDDQVKEAGLINHQPWTVKLIQLYETQLVRHGIMVLGPSGSGKTSCIQILQKALTQAGEPHKEMRMNPKAVSAAQMFGRLDVATNDWTDGIFSTLWRRTHKSKKGGEHIWIVLDGPVDSIWIENLNSVLDDNRTLTLANGDRIPMASNCKIIFEPDNINNASPATVSRNGMVYMSSSALDWKPIAQAWFKKCPAGYCKNLLENILCTVFPKVHDWTKHNIVYKMELLQVNVITQFLNLLEGLMPIKNQSDDDKVQLNRNPDGISILWSKNENKESHIRRNALFCLMWSTGAVLELEDRQKLEIYYRETPEIAQILDFPPRQTDFGASMFDFFVSESGHWVHWSSRVAEYIFPDASLGPIDFSSFLVPNIDNVRTDFLIDTIAKQKKAVLLTGEQGSAKTVITEAYLKKLNPDVFLCRKMNFSCASAPHLFQKSMESYLDKRIGNTFGPPGGKKMVVFIDDISMPQINEWKDQITNEIVRQTIEMKGSGRNDIPARLKRHFSIFNCTLPTPPTIDKIFGAIATGYYCSKRGFTYEVQEIVAKLVPVTRKLWAQAKSTLLPTPAKFHYIFNLRDLSRIWQGMIGTQSNVVDSQKVLLKLWKHENTRVIADRFTDVKDKDWFNETLVGLVDKELGKAYGDMIRDTSYFVDFLRDAPEPTGDEPEAETEVEMPKIYEPLPNFSLLEERLRMFLAQHNDMVRGSGMDLVFFNDAMCHILKHNDMVRGSGMDLVFFNDAMCHILKISRIIRNPGGNALLVGVGGSGKKSLTQLASFIAGYKTFQITLSRTYNMNNFLEDLKVLYRTCGIQGKGMTFLFTDQDIKEEGFLEYLNNVLSSGRVSNLFNRDEQGEIIVELIPIMKREHPRSAPTPENVLDFFETRVRQNLHVVLCFSPVGEKFRNRANKFPGLFSGCTIDWFQPWPRDALIAVAQHYLKEFEMICTPAVRPSLVKAMANTQEVVSDLCIEYFERLRRSAHVTPKSFMTFLNLYKSVYSKRYSEIAELAERMDHGLGKLQEASTSVSQLKAELFVMEKELEIASAKANEAGYNDINALFELPAKEAETIRNQVRVKKDDAQVLVDIIAADKAWAEQKLEAARPALEEAISALNTIKPAHIGECLRVVACSLILMRCLFGCLIARDSHGPEAGQAAASDYASAGLRADLVQDPTASRHTGWTVCVSKALVFLASTNFLQNLERFPKDTMNDEVVELLEPYFIMDDYNMETALRVCGDVAGLLSWTKSMAFFYGVNKEVLPLKANLAMQEARLALAMADFSTAEKELRSKEVEVSRVRDWYSKAVAERERLCEAALTCRRKMNAAETLINGLVGEKVRWTSQSKAFKDQTKRLIGDVVIATAFISYAGPFNQEFRSRLMHSWQEIIRTRDIPCSDEINVVGMLVDPPTISEWHLQGLPNDELSVQNAVIATKASCFPLLIDPQGQGKLWIRNREISNDLQVVVGDKEFDIVPGFTLYLTTKMSNPSFTPETSAKTAVIDFTVTMKGLEDQLLGRVILTEKSELEAERVALVEDVLDHKRTIQQLEDNLLSKLTSIEGSLVDDEELIAVLASTKATAQEVSQKLKIAADTERKINQVREEFRPVAKRGSTLYFLIVEMSNVNAMYQTSLRQFLFLFELSMSRAASSNMTYARICNIINYMTSSVWKFASRGFYERHKFLFTLLLAVKIDLHTEKVTFEEFMTLIKGKVIKEHEKEWKEWWEHEATETRTLPSNYSQTLDAFRTLLLIRSWCPDRTLFQAKIYVENSLGDEFRDVPILDMDEMCAESDSRTPLICLLSLGADPTSQIEALARTKDIVLRSVSMGQGQEHTSRKLLNECMTTGHWVLLQNGHLSLSFCEELVETVNETPAIHPNFRLWLTTEYHTEFPVALLQMSIKFTNEPPQGVKASLKRTYTTMSQDVFEYSSIPQWQPLLFSVSFLHTIVLVGKYA